MEQVDLLKRQRERLKKDIAAQLDFFLIGSVGKSSTMAGHSLTTKIKGKTVTVYVRKHIARKAKGMAKRYKVMWRLIQKLSKINWEILKQENE